MYNTEMDKKSEFLKGSQTPKGRSCISCYSVCCTVDHVLSGHSQMEKELTIISPNATVSTIHCYEERLIIDNGDIITLLFYIIH